MISSATFCPASLMSVRTTEAPSRAKSRAVARPMPEAAPVMRAICPLGMIRLWESFELICTAARTLLLEVKSPAVFFILCGTSNSCPPEFEVSGS